MFLIADRARAAAFIGPKADHKADHKEGPEVVIDGVKAARFGHWETTEDLEADGLLMDAIEAWAKGQGAGVIYGPIDVTTYGTYRVRQMSMALG